MPNPFALGNWYENLKEFWYEPLQYINRIAYNANAKRFMKNNIMLIDNFKFFVPFQEAEDSINFSNGISSDSRTSSTSSDSEASLNNTLFSPSDSEDGIKINYNLSLKKDKIEDKNVSNV